MESLNAALDRFQQKPKLFFTEVLGIETLEEYQDRIAQDVADNERTAVAACHDVGKTYLMARIVIWFCTCFPYSKVITTAPTYNQVKNILWSEIRSAHARSKYPLGGKMNLTDWHLSRDGDWFAIGFTPKNEVTLGEGQGTQSSFQGFHAPYILVVFDEATGIPHGVWTMAEGLLTSDRVKFVAIGNPTSRNSEFFRCFSSPAWKKVYLSCFDSPNMIANGFVDMKSVLAELAKIKELSDGEAQARMASYKAPRPYLLSARWVMASLLKWKPEHPLSVSKIFGKFPEEGDSTLIPLLAVEQSQERHEDCTPALSARKTLGVDVARFGTDSTVLTGLHGMKQILAKELTKRDVVYVSGQILSLIKSDGYNVVVIDETGVGGGVVDLVREGVREQNLKCEVRGVQFGAAVECDGQKDCKHVDCEKGKYANFKAKLFGLLADDMRRHDGLALMSNAIYLEELPTILYGYDSRGRMVIESKDEYKKRTGRGSPDHGDSLALANFGHYSFARVGTFSRATTDFTPPFAASIGAIKSW